MLSYCSDESGEWLAATRPGCLLVVRTDGSLDAVGRLWSSLDGGAQGILDGLTSAGLFATPPFALLTWEVSARPGFTGRAILRGDVSLRLTGEHGDAEISGLGVSTWREQPFSAITEITAECGEHGDPLPSLPSLPALPLSSGIVRARRISLSTSTAAPFPVAERAGTPATVSAPVHAVPIRAEATIAEETITDQTIAVVRSGGVGPAPTPAADVVGPAPGQGYDHLFGVTMMRGVEQAAVRPAEDGAEPAVAVDADADDNDAGGDAADPGRHDGLTVMSGDIRTLRDSRRRSRPLPDAAAVAAQPALYLLLPNGVREPLGQPIVVGRAPGVNKVSGGQVPRLVSLGGADQDISRNHVRITVEGDTVVVTDLHSRNGTIIVLPGKPPQKLRGGESTSVIVGTVVDLGGGVTLAVGQDAGES
ncbi:hypothetical protein RCH16_000715 [Cryobacterium sp. MP_M5]|uniref:FHA domain-containing protein n=1 Tax=unclassified Cryobacterium TaxID=2649013 RepID=UPI0018C9979C|nr:MULTISPECIES: FHA domain-containing protein [unclassified Cryobacterium]MBG6057763.1 hypothetical protein [Cryobacterium sp. MP_M3]MEC5175722.1 hypothetical protein [Cryobacterium sp. MP_M5]